MRRFEVLELLTVWRGDAGMWLDLIIRHVVPALEGIVTEYLVMAKKANEGAPDTGKGSSVAAETEEAASLRRIMELNRSRKAKWAELQRAEAQHEAAKGRLKEAREEYEEARLELEECTEIETEGLPLFPPMHGVRPKPRELPPVEVGSPFTPVPRLVFLAELPGMPHTAVVTLGCHGIQTTADLEVFLGEKGDMTTLQPGLSPAIAEKVIRSFALFLQKRAEGEGT